MEPTVRHLVQGWADMAAGRSLGREFAWLWAAFAISTLGTWLAFDAFPLIAILVLHSGSTAVSMLTAAGLAVGALAAIPLGVWVEFRRKRPVMMAMDLIRFAALVSIPVSYVLGRLGLTQLVVVSMIVAAASISFRAASGAYVKGLIRAEDLVVANARFESTTWTATMLGPPLGGFAIGLFGPVITVVADALTYLLSALGIVAIGGREPQPVRIGAQGLRAGELFEGWRFIVAHPVLRRLVLNTILVNGLIMATAPLLAVLMLGRLGFTPWQYGLAFAAPCLGGLIGSRFAQGLAERFGQRRILLIAGTLRACWSLGLVLIRPGLSGLVLVLVLEFGLITCAGVFNPVFSSFRLEQSDPDYVARILSSWSVSSKASIATMTALWGVLAGLTGPRVAIGIAGGLMLLTPLLLPWRKSAFASLDSTAVAAQS